MYKINDLLKKVESFLLREKKKASSKNPVLSIVPDSVVTEFIDKAEEVAVVVDQASENLVKEVKKETEKVVKAAKKTPSKNKPAATKKKSTPKKNNGGGGGSDQQVV